MEIRETNVKAIRSLY